MISQSIITKLKEKGVSADIILDLILEDEQTPDVPENPEETPAPEVPAAPQTPQPITGQDIQQAGQTQDAILAAINKLTGAIHASNILNSGSKGPDIETSADALAQIINPKGGK